MNETQRLLVALADAGLREHLIGQLLADGYALDAAGAVREAQLKAATRPDLVLLGELGPGEALGLLRELRAGRSSGPALDPTLPVVILLADAGQLALLRAFEAGADDALGPPVSYLELRARVRALLRRTGTRRAPTPRHVGALAIDPVAREVRYAGRPLALARMEFELLCRLAAEPLRVYSKRELLRELWGYPDSARTRTLDAHACRLRRRLAAAGARGYVVNVRGVGYRLLACSEPAALAERNGQRPNLELVRGG